MYFLLRFSPLLTSFAGFLYLELLLKKPAWAGVLLGDLSIKKMLTLLIGVAVFYFIELIFLGAGYPFFTRLRFWPYLLFLWFSGVTIFAYSDSYALLRTLTIALPVLTYIWLESLFLFWQRPMAYQAYTLQRIASYLYLIILFLVTSALTGVQILLQLPFWVILTVLVVIYWEILFDLFCLHKLRRSSAGAIALLGAFFGAQLLIVLNLLPTHFFLYGLIIMLFYYTWNGILLQVYREGTSDIKASMYLVTSGLGSIILFFSILFWR